MTIIDGQNQWDTEKGVTQANNDAPTGRRPAINTVANSMTFDPVAPSESTKSVFSLEC